MNVLFIGACGNKYNVQGGEIAKSRTIQIFLVKKYNTKVIDVYWERKNCLQYLWNITFSRAIRILQVIFYGKKADKIIISRTDATYVKILNKIKSAHKILLFGVGGRVHKLLYDQVPDADFWNKLRGIYVESEHMVNEFSKLEINNVKYLPNFKYLPHYTDVHFNNSGVLQLFYLGRICDEKGCVDLFSAVNHLNEDGFICHLTLYGSVEKDFSIDSYLNKNIEYKGNLNLVNSVDDYEELRKQDVFVFPTKWAGEGFAGALIDAMAVGKPIIATKHNVNERIVRDGELGILYQPGNVSELESAIMKFYNNRELLDQYGRAALVESKKYDVENVLSKIC